MIAYLVGGLALVGIGFSFGVVWCLDEVERERRARQARLQHLVVLMFGPRIPSALPGDIISADQLHPFDREAFGA